MEITFKIPPKIIETGKKCGWDEEQIKDVFKQYISELVNHPYEHFQHDFENYIESEEFEDEFPHLKN